MIWTLIGFIILSIGIFSAYINSQLSCFDWKDDLTLGVGVFGIIIGGLASIAFLIIIISAHVNVDKKIHDADMQYKSLVKQVECIDSDYEDVSKATVIENVYEWNKDVYNAKYWSENKWTNWFWSKEYVDSLKYIEMEEYKNDN